VTASTDAETDTRPQAWAWAVLIAIVAISMIVGAVLIVSSGETEGEQVIITVPAGTAARVDAGEKVELMPSELELTTDDVLVIHNEDDETAVIGPFSVRAGETLRHTFTSPGRYEGVCALNPSGRVVITVT
jgi:plastocyanin